MLVRIQGRRASGEAVTRSWHLLAEGDDGPLIPSMAIAALVQRGLDGHRPLPGARPAVAELELADYQALFARRTIHAGTREDSVASRARPLYQRVLGPAFEHLPAPLRLLHDIEGVAEFTGEAAVERGRNPLARLVAGVFGFPRAGAGVPVRVRLQARDGGEVWTRDFAGKLFSSVQSAGKGRWEALLCERFGPFNFGLALVIDGDRLALVPRRWSVLGLPLPLALAPRGNTYEHGEDGRFHFHVEIGLPLVGLLVRYRGHLLPVAATPATLS